MTISFQSDIDDHAAAYMDAFLSETSLDRYRRACTWTASEVAKAASQSATAAIDDAFDSPTRWMRRAFQYTRALPKKGGVIAADLKTRPDQSIVMKYAMGEAPTSAARATSAWRPARSTSLNDRTSP